MIMQNQMERLEPKRDKYNIVLSNILAYLDNKEMIALENCSVVLREELQKQRLGKLSTKKVLIAYGGGKDSSYMLTYVRAIQLLILKKYGETFKIRICTNRQMGMIKAVMENIHSVYMALGLYEDRYSEMFLIDAHEITPFDKDLPISNTVKEISRKEVLMSGHRSQGDGRPTFCNACNLSMVNSFGITAWYEGGVDMVITGDSKKELRDYYIWVKRLSLKLGDQSNAGRGFDEFLHSMNYISEKYFRETFGENADQEVQKRAISINTDKIKAPTFFSIFDYTSYDAGDHWELLTDFLGFQFDSIAFSFSETDCANPALMAHLRGLKSEKIRQKNYADGIAEYLSLAIELMRKKNFPKQLIEIAIKRYEGEKAISIMRNKMQEYSKECFDLTEEQLVCMVYSPFIDNGVRLGSYLAQEQPKLVPFYNEIHSILSDNISDSSNENLLEKLFEISGLTLSEMQALYSQKTLTLADKSSVVSMILKDDPHKKIIETRHELNGELVKEVISGR